jgi:tetratricopeptide (TPR) repeat protein
MSDSPPPGLVRQAVNLLGDVGGFVAVLVAYVLALSGRSPGPIPQTTAVITVLVTTVVVWAWRANRITRRRYAGQPTALAGDMPPAEPVQPTPTSRLLDPFRSVGNPPYAMPLARRRTELTGLAMLTLASAVWLGVRLPDALSELTGGVAPRALGRCYPAGNTRAPRVVIADFNESATTQSIAYVEDRLYDSLTANAGDDRQICRLYKTVGTKQEAREVGQSTHAVLVVWGRSDVLYEAHLELANGAVSGWDVPGLDLAPLPTEEVADYAFASKEHERLSFLTDFVLSQLLYLQHQPETARALLGRALSQAEEAGFVQANAADLGEAYFFLGFLFDPHVTAQPDAQQALDAYTRAIELKPGFPAALLNRGNLYMESGVRDLAFADYTALIAMRGPLSATAAANRAGLRPDRAAAEEDLAVAVALDPPSGYLARGSAREERWKDMAGALDDYAAAVQSAPEDWFYYHVLGHAQLRAGQTAAARATFRAAVPYLDSASREMIVGALEQLIEEMPETAEGSRAIIADLRAVRVPQAAEAAPR